MPSQAERTACNGEAAEDDDAAAAAVGVVTVVGAAATRADEGGVCGGWEDPLAEGKDARDAFWAARSSRRVDIFFVVFGVVDR